MKNQHQSNQHQSVMLAEAINALNIRENGYYVDATAGRGGHSQAILDKLGTQGKLLAFDRDKDAIKYIDETIKDARLELIHQPFSTLEQVLSKKSMLGRVDGVLMDLGVSSPQLDNPDRGFSFLNDGPLDMRMDTRQETTVASWLAKADADEIADVLYQYGDEKKSRVIARAIKKTQEKQDIITTKQLADIVAGVVFSKKQHKHPATRTFQALRIFINQELSELQNILAQLMNCLSVGGVMVIMSFHSLEDRIVKQFMAINSKQKSLPRNLPIQDTHIKMPLKVFKKSFASKQEITHNIRSRSVILRVAQKIIEVNSVTPHFIAHS